MKLHSLILDNFLTQFDALRACADEAQYETVQSPADGVDYPGICVAVPGSVQREIHENLEIALGTRVSINVMFMRLSLSGVPVPHQAHSDSVMGAYSLMLYLNRPEHCQGGTSLVRHETGMDRTPVTSEQETFWRHDTNTPENWKVYSLCEMKPNRAFIFDAALMHRAEPLGGFGDSARNGRLVLTAFFT